MPSDESEMVPSRSSSTCDRLVAICSCDMRRDGNAENPPSSDVVEGRSSIARSRRNRRLSWSDFAQLLGALLEPFRIGAVDRTGELVRRCGSSWPCVASSPASPLVGSASTSSMAATNSSTCEQNSSTSALPPSASPDASVSAGVVARLSRCRRRCFGVGRIGVVVGAARDVRAGRAAGRRWRPSEGLGAQRLRHGVVPSGCSRFTLVFTGCNDAVLRSSESGLPKRLRTGSADRAR